jgi:hypothetical protein
VSDRTKAKQRPKTKKSLKLSSTKRLTFGKCVPEKGFAQTGAEIGYVYFHLAGDDEILVNANVPE